MSNAQGKTLVLVAESDANTTVFETIVLGIENTGEDIETRVISPGVLAQIITTTPGQYQSVIVLGRALIDTPFDEPSGVPVLLAGYTGSIQAAASIRRISLNIDPAFVLLQIEKTKGSVEKVFTSTSSPFGSTQEMERLRRIRSLAVEVVRADSERESARSWFDITRSADSKDEVIWILDDQYLDSSGNYRYLIESAWRRKLLVVSSIPRFARRGVAIGFIPVLSAYAERLVLSVKRMEVDNRFMPEPVLGADVVQRVFNKRTLQHIGARLPEDLDRGEFSDIVIE